MDEHDGSCFVAEVGLDALWCHAQRPFVHVYEHRLESIFCYGENCGEKRVGWHYDLVSGLYAPEFDECTQSEGEGVEPVGDSYTVSGAYVSGIVVFKSSCRFALQIPSASDDIVHCLCQFVEMHFGDALEIQIWNVRYGTRMCHNRCPFLRSLLFDILNLH